MLYRIVVNKALHDSALGSINAHKNLWSQADLKFQTFKSELERLDSKDEPGLEAKKTSRKIQLLKDRVINQKLIKDTAKSEISILERQTWNKELTDPSEESITKIKEAPSQKESEQEDPTRYKKKLLYA